MICFKCGVKLSDDSKYCPRCGTIFSKKEDVSLYCNRDDLEYINIYFSKNNFNLYLYNISLGFLFFNCFYLLYKKLYLEGIISFFTFILFIFLVLFSEPIFMNSMGFFALPIIFGFLFCFFIFFYYLLNMNNIYIAKCKYRINKIIKENNNLSKEEIIKLLNKDSKPNLWAPIVSFLCLALFVFFVAL